MPIDSDKIHTHLSKISRINFVLAVLAFIGVAALYAWFRWGADSATVNDNANTSTNTAAQLNTNTATNAPAATPEDIQEQTEEYQNEINAALEGFGFNDSTKAAELLNRVIGMRVPADLRQMHLQVVVALQDAQKGEYDQANERFHQLRAQYSWFLP